MRFIACVALISLLFLSEGMAQKIVDPATVAPEFRAAAEKRRAEQLMQQECAKQADAAKVLPRDRVTYLAHCLDTEAAKSEHADQATGTPSKQN